MHFFLIDPKQGSVTKLTGKPNLEKLYELLDCRLIDVVRLNGTTDVMIVDDEGLFAGHTEMIEIDDCREMYRPKIKGKMIYIGSTFEGDYCEPEHTFSFDALYLNEDNNVTQVDADPGKKVCCKLKLHTQIDKSFYPMYFSIYCEPGTPDEQRIIELELQTYLNDENKEAGIF